MGSVLVTYATRTQAARDVAAALADCFSRAGHRVRLSDLATEDPAAALVGRQVMAVVNFPPRQIGPVRSEVLVLGVSDPQGGIVLLAPDLKVPNGGRMH